MDKLYEYSRKAKPLFERSWYDEPYLLENLLVAQAQARESGEYPRPAYFEICLSSLGQNVAHQSVMFDFPEEIKLLEEIFAKEEPVSKAQRCGVIAAGSPAIILSYSFDGEELKCEGVLDRNLLHACTRMMAEQLNEALLSYSVNICATFNSDFRDEDHVADEIHAIIRADRDPEARNAFEKEFGALLERLALSRDADWVKKQYDKFVAELKENTNKNWRPYKAIKNGCSVEDIAIEACGFLGQHLGRRQFMFDTIQEQNAHHKESCRSLEKLTEKCNSENNPDLLEKCLYNGSIRAEFNGDMKVTLFTKPLEGRRTPVLDCFQIKKNELRSILNEMGYEKDVTVSSFLGSYSYEAAREIKTLYEERQKKPLAKRLSEAEQKRSNFEQKGPVQKKEQEREL